MSFILELRSLLERSEDLPTLPDVVFELHNAFDNEHVGQEDLAAIIARDPALMARLLRAANSPTFRRGDPIADVNIAIQRMGMRNVRATWIVLGVVKSFEGMAGGLDHRLFWNHASAVGLVAQRVWRYSGLTQFGEDQLYVAGLLHDIGLLVLDQYFPEQMSEIMEVGALSGEPRPNTESLVLGMDHGEIGGLFLGNWSLPDVVVQAVAHHHDPGAAPEDFAAASQALCAAEYICADQGIGVFSETNGVVDDVAPALPASAVERAAADLITAMETDTSLSIV